MYLTQTVIPSSGRHHETHWVTRIILSFSGAVNAPEADNVATYRLVRAGRKKSFTARNAEVIKLRSAVYNAADNTVTLTPRKPLFLSKPIELVVDGVPPSGLEDDFGRLIAGDSNGQPGGNAVAVLSRNGVAIS